MNDKERIEYCQRIIAAYPNTPKARNAKWLIREIKTQSKKETDSWKGA